MAADSSEHHPKAGDLIEIYRHGYQHWAYFIGGDEVVHFTTADDDRADNLKTIDGFVKRQKLSVVTHSDRFRVNNALDDKYTPRDFDIVYKEACGRVGESVPYNLATHNCEHFVTELRYGKPESIQVRHAAEIGTAVGALLVFAAGALVAWGGLGAASAIVGPAIKVAVGKLQDAEGKEEEEEEGEEQEEEKGSDISSVAVTSKETGK